MSKTRLEAFSDGVIAIIITIMVLELKVPHGAELSDLHSVMTHFGVYVLSFVYVGIYWNNHHHLLQAAECVNGSILWANMHLLFWLSLIPFASGWMGEHGLSPWPVALYGSILFIAGVAYFILCRALIAQHGKKSALARAISVDTKSIVSLAMYLTGVVFAFFYPWVSHTLNITVAILWLIPDRRIERAMHLEKC